MSYAYRKLVSFTALVISASCFLHGSDESFCEEPCAPQYCCPESCGHFFIGADLLYFRAYEGGLTGSCDSTRTCNTVEDGVVVSRLKGSGNDLDFDWNAGFRVGAGYEFADRNLDLGVFWTNYNSHTNSHRHRNQQHWKVDYNVVDVIVSCDWNWSNCCSLTPFGGVKYASIDQKLHNRFVSIVDEVPSTLRNKSKEDFSGFGPLFGIAGVTPLGCGFSLYGNISVAILYGHFHVKSRSREVFDTGINVDFTRNHITACQPVVDAGFGVRWNTCMCDKIVWVQAGFEQHRFFNHNQFCSYGDFSLDGASLAFGVGF